MARPSVQPPAVDLVVFGTRMHNAAITLRDFPSGARFTTQISLADPASLRAKVAQVTVYRMEERQIWIDLQPGECPPHRPGGCPDGEFQTVLEKVVVGQSNGTTPVLVEAGQIVEIGLIVQAVGPNFDRASGTLLITGDAWDPIAVPLLFQSGSEISSQYQPAELTAEPGGVATSTVTARWVSGPAVEVNYHMVNWGESIGVTMEPENASLWIHPGETKTTTLTFRIHRDCRPARKYLRIVQTGGLVDERTLILDVVPAGLSVGTRPLSITAKQGDTVTFEVSADSEGLAKNMTFAPGVLPAGVHMDPVSFVVGPGRASQTRPVRMSIDRYAPTTDRAWNPISWTASNGIQHGGVLNLPLTIELNPEERVFRQEITTPAGTALGGFAEVVIRNDGTYTFRGHMHGSGFDSYDFRVGFFLATPIVTLADTFTSRVGGTIGGGPRDRDWDQPGRNELIREHWATIRNSSCMFSKWYENTGVLGTLEEFAVTVAEFLVLRALAGPAAAATLILGPELAKMADMPLTRPHRIPGSIILSGVVILFGPLAAVPAVVAGIAVARAEDVKSRRLHQSEIDEARKVFGDTLPIDRIRVTNLLRYGVLGVANFCDYNPIDETIILGMGDAYDTAITNNPSFIHELTHAWQWAHNAFSPAKMWGAINRQFFMSAEEVAELYRIYGDGRPWRDFHSEGQAEAVELWYSLFRNDLNSDAARSHIFFRYIANNIRMGNP